MKRLICFLATAILLFGASAYADRHVDIQCTAAGTPEAVITFDLYEQDGAVYTLSSLFPDFVYRADVQACFSVSDLTEMISMRSGAVGEIDKTIWPLFLVWVQKRLSEPEYDTWAGELFENASSARTAQFNANELIGLTELHPEEDLGAVSDGPGSAFIRSLTSKILNVFMDSGMRISLRCFEEGKYYSASISLQDDIIMTVSADCSDNSGKRLLIVYRENGRYYCRDITYKYDDESFMLSSSLRSTESSSCAGDENGTLLFSETFSMNNATDQSATFQWTFVSPSLGDPLIITGTSNAGNDKADTLQASVCISDTANEVIHITASSEPLIRPVTFGDKETIESGNKNGNDRIALSATTRLMLFVAEIIPALPQPYHNIIWNLLAL